jgi:hypothetical protein
MKPRLRTSASPSHATRVAMGRERTNLYLQPCITDYESGLQSQPTLGRSGSAGITGDVSNRSELDLRCNSCAAGRAFPSDMIVMDRKSELWSRKKATATENDVLL